MTDKWIKDTGEVLALVLLFLGIINNYKYFIILAFVALIITSVAPNLLKPIAFLWKKITEILAYIMPRVFFGFVYFVIVTPIGYMRRLLGYDSLSLKNNSAKLTSFITRNHLFTKKDLIKPY
jgi:hypothetical protein